MENSDPGLTSEFMTAWQTEPGAPAAAMSETAEPVAEVVEPAELPEPVAAAPIAPAEVQMALKGPFRLEQILRTPVVDRGQRVSFPVTVIFVPVAYSGSPRLPVFRDFDYLP